MVQFIQFPFSIFTNVLIFTNILFQRFTCTMFNNKKNNDEPGRKHDNIRVDLAIQLKLNTYRIMNNLHDTSCTNSKVSATLTSLPVLTRN